MQWPSYLLSFCLHGLFFLLIWLWPNAAPMRLEPPAVMISLVDGDMGGSNTPSNILGHLGERGGAEMAPSPTAPKKEVAAPSQEEVLKDTPTPKPSVEAPKEPSLAVEQPKPEPKPKPKPKPEPKPKPKPEPKKEPKPVIKVIKSIPTFKEKPKEKPKEQPKEQPKETKKEKAKDDKAKTKSKDAGDPIAQALKQAKREASSRLEQGDSGNAVEQALAQAKRNAGGNRGGGGGQGKGPGGGGLADVYRGQVLLAVRPNWGYASTSRKNLSCLINVKVDMQGKVQEATVVRSSGNTQFDQSAVSAIWRTSNNGAFPPPPSQAYTDLDLNFSLNELLGR